MAAVTNIRSQVVMPPMEELAPFIDAGDVDGLLGRLVEAKVVAKPHSRFGSVVIDEGDGIQNSVLTIRRPGGDVAV